MPHECRVLSAHRTPARDGGVRERRPKSRGIEVIIAAAGGAAHLAGVCAAHTLLPVLGVPMESASLKGMDSLLSTVQMPAGIPVGTLAIGPPGARNAALLAVAILANHRPRAAREAAPLPRGAARQGAAGNAALSRRRRRSPVLPSGLMPVKITPQNNGPIRIEGEFEIVDPTGAAFGLGRPDCDLALPLRPLRKQALLRRQP